MYYWCVSASQGSVTHCYNRLVQAKKGLVSDKKYSEARLDILSCLLLAERAMTGPPTLQVTSYFSYSFYSFYSCYFY